MRKICFETRVPGLPDRHRRQVQRNRKCPQAGRNAMIAQKVKIRQWQNQIAAAQQQERR